MNAWPIFRDGKLELVQTSHQQLAIRAAQEGNWKPADALELARLCREVRPRNADGEITDFRRLIPEEIWRNAGPNGEDVAIWVWRRRSTPWNEEELITDLDGLILEDRLP